MIETTFKHIKIEKFFIPVYENVTDANELTQDFSIWNKYLRKYLNI